MVTTHRHDDQADWRRYRRLGQVVARRLSEDLQWHNRGGDPLRGRSGDWVLRTPDTPDTDPKTWTITDDEFRATYAHVAGDVYERTGTVEARPGVVGEVIETLEGDVRVGSGDWVVRRPDSPAIWVVPGDLFMARYAAES